jgi:uncharacterized protein
VKLLLFLIIVYLAYRAGKAWILKSLGVSARDGSPHPPIDDVMVQDPICGTHFPRREAVELRHDGQVLLFCSAACRDRFLERQKP